MTDDLRLGHGAFRTLVALPIGAHCFGPAAMGVMLDWDLSLES